MTVWMNQLVFPMYKLQRSAQQSFSNHASNEVLQKQVWILRKSDNQQVLWYPTLSKCQRIGQDTTNPVHSVNYGQYRSEWTEANIKNAVFADASIRQVYKAGFRKECLHERICGGVQRIWKIRRGKNENTKHLKETFATLAVSPGEC